VTSNQAQKRLLEHIERHHRAGLFTHVYVACGTLDERDPGFSFSSLPDGRRIFDLASLTKALVTTPLILAERELCPGGLEGLVSDWLPANKAALLDVRLRKLSILSLLRHRSGLPAWANFWLDEHGQNRFGQSLHPEEAAISALNRSADRLTEPAVPVYSDLGFILLGLILQWRRQENLAESFVRMAGCLDDTEVLDIGFAPHLVGLNEMAISTGFCPIRQRALVGEVHDENCAVLAGVSGHAGLFASGEALGLFLRSLLTSDLNHELLSLNASYRGLDNTDFLCGWRLGSGLSSSVFGAGQAMGHLGFTGTAFWIVPPKPHASADLAQSRYGILLTNRVISGRASEDIALFRRGVFEQLDVLSQTSD